MQHPSLEMHWTHKHFQESGHLALIKIRKSDTDQSWHHLCSRCAEANPPQISVCHLSAVASEELHRQFFFPSSDVRPTNHKTPASCTNTTTEAEFSENLHELTSVLMSLKGHFLNVCSIYIFFYRNTNAILRPQD